MRNPGLWWREGRGQWFTTIRGKQVPLGPDKRRATAEFHRLMVGDERGRGGSLSVQEILDLWLGEVQATVKPLTFHRYRQNAQWFADFAGSIRATDLKPLHLGQWTKNPAWKSDATKSLGISVVKMAFRWAAREGWLERDPIALCKAPGDLPRRPAAPGEIERLMASELPEGLRDILGFMLGTGCRPGEAMSLEASTIAWDEATALVRGKRGQRLVVLPTGILERLRGLAAEHPAGPLFRNRAGTPWCDRTLGRAIATARARAGVGWVVASHCRKHFATRMVAAGTDSALVAKLLGHKDTSQLQMLMRHYYHPDLAELKRAIGNWNS